MATFSYDLFVKKQNLTEAGLGVPNTLWSDIENYIQDPEIWRQNLITNSKWTERASDIGLRTLIKKYYQHKLIEAKFELSEFSFEIYKTDEYDGNYGLFEMALLNSSNKLRNYKEIKVKIRICLFRISEISSENTLRSLYHELIHLEEGITAITNIGMENLTQTLSPFDWISINKVLNKPKNKTTADYVNSTDERNAYAGDLALQLFYKYRPYFRQQTTKEQEQFINNKIIPNIKYEFSYNIQNEFITNLIKSNKFYISLIKQLIDLASRIAVNV